MTVTVEPIREPGWYQAWGPDNVAHWYSPYSCHQLDTWRSACERSKACTHWLSAPVPKARHCELCERALAKREAKK